MTEQSSGWPSFETALKTRILDLAELKLCKEKCNETTEKSWNDFLNYLEKTKQEKERKKRQEVIDYIQSR